jgi:hypothetical protein
MEPETPSRRKKSGDKAVTIDLEAVPVSADNETVEEPTSTETAADPATEAEATAPGQQPPDEALSRQADEPAAKSYIPDNQPSEPQLPPQQKSSAGALAAGILGGLIALLGAGSLQYGGYLPSLGPGGTDDGAITTMAADLETLKARVAETPQAGPVIDLQPIDTRIAALEKAISEGPATAEATNPEALTAMQADVTRMATELAALREAITRTSQAVSETGTQLSERIAAAEQKLDEPRTDIEMARAVAASALKTAIDRGGPYLAELEAFSSVSPEDPAVAGLREHAAIGVSSRSNLVRDFPAVADAILDAAHQPEGDQGIIDRLISSAASAIRVRPVGSIEGATPEAIVARIESKLQNGDFKGAQIEWQTLPEAAQAAATDFKRSLDQRVTVEDLIGGVVSGAMSGTGNQG